MNFLTSGERLKVIRKKLNMKQSELIASGVTRNFISMVERNQRKLNIDTANKISDIFHEKAKELNLQLQIDAHYLMNTEEEEAREYCLKELEKEDACIDEIIEIAKKYGLTEILAKIYLKKGDMLYKKRNYIEAFDSYYTSLELYKELNQENRQGYIYNKLGKCEIMLTNYDEALLFLRRAYDFSLLYGDDFTKKNSIFNLVLCYNSINQIDEALIFINKYIDLCPKEKEFDRYIDGIIEKAICKKNQGEYKEAIALYKHLIEILKHKNYSEILARLYNNLGLLYMELENYNYALKCLEKSENIRCRINSYKLCHSLIDKGNLYLKANRKEEGERLILQGIELAKIYDDKRYLIKAYEMLTKIYGHKKDYVKLENLCKEILKLNLKDRDDRLLIDTYIKLAIVNLEKNNVESAIYVLLKAIHRNIYRGEKNEEKIN